MLNRHLHFENSKSPFGTQEWELRTGRWAIYLVSIEWPGYEFQRGAKVLCLQKSSSLVFFLSPSNYSIPTKMSWFGLVCLVGWLWSPTPLDLSPQRRRSGTKTTSAPRPRRSVVGVARASAVGVTAVAACQVRDEKRRTAERFGRGGRKQKEARIYIGKCWFADEL